MVAVEETEVLPLALSLIDGVAEKVKLQLGEGDTLSLSLSLREGFPVLVRKMLEEED